VPAASPRHAGPGGRIEPTAGPGRVGRLGPSGKRQPGRPCPGRRPDACRPGVPARAAVL